MVNPASRIEKRVRHNTVKLRTAHKPQRRNARHRRVLVQAAAHRVRHRIDQARVAVEIGKPLAQVDRAVLLRERRHDGEDGGADVRQAGDQFGGSVHGRLF